MKALVAYFSAESGRTANAAKSLAAAIGADLFEIKPEKPYTSSDLNYMNPLARCNREHITKKQVPVSGTVKNFAEYDTVLLVHDAVHEQFDTLDEVPDTFYFNWINAGRPYAADVWDYDVYSEIGN